jgi:hypothetical protein
MVLNFACEDAFVALKQAYKEYLKGIGGLVKGKWSLIPDNKTLLFKSDFFIYEVDLERDDIFQWEKHLLETKRLVMSKSDIKDMVTLWNRAVPSMCTFSR